MDGQLKQEVADTIKKAVGIFTVQYTKAYMLAIVRMIKLESTQEKIDWHLETRPPRGLREGYLIKESVHLKKWNRRYFRFNPDYTIDYFDSEDRANQLEKKGKAGKKRGSINLSGYYVHEDPNHGILVRLKKLAEKMGVDFSSLPKPKEYPPLTFEVYHPRRPCLYLKCETQEEFDQWVATFKTACWNARGMSWDDWCHRQAYPIALRKTRWEFGRWGWWVGQGSEENLLAELITDELEWDVMGRIYCKLKGPWIIRNKMRNLTVKTIDAMVLAAVKPAWAGMRKAAEELRPKVEPKIREMVGPIFEAEAKIASAMRDAVMSVLEPLLKEHVTPHLAKIVTVIKSPMRDAFEEAANLFDDRITKWKPSEDMSKSFGELDYFSRSYWELRDALRKPDEMYELLWALREIFSDIHPWGLIWKAHNLVYQHTDNAVYTWEQAMLKENNPELAEQFKRDVIIKYKHDTEIATQKYYKNILKKIVLPPFEACVHPVAKNIIDPLAETIPEPLREFIDIKQMFEDLYKGIVKDCIVVVLQSG